MTARQRQIVDFITQFTADKGFSPSFQEIADHLGISTISSVHKHLQRMHRKGIINLGKRNEARSVSVVQSERTAKGCTHCAILQMDLDRAHETIELLKQRIIRIESR